MYSVEFIRYSIIALYNTLLEENQNTQINHRVSYRGTKSSQGVLHSGKGGVQRNEYSMSKEGDESTE